MNGSGFTETKVNDIINNYSEEVYQQGEKTVYIKENGEFYDVIITNSEGQVVTAGEETRRH